MLTTKKKMSFTKKDVAVTTLTKQSNVASQKMTQLETNSSPDRTEYEIHSITHKIFLPKMFSLNLTKTDLIPVYKKYKGYRNKLNDITRKHSDKSRMWDTMQNFHFRFLILISLLCFTFLYLTCWLPSSFLL